MKRASKHQSNWPIAHEKQTLSFMDAQKDRQAGRLTVFCVSTSLQTWGTCVGHLWVWRHKMHSKIYGHGSLKGTWLETTSMILVIMSSTMIITIQEINKVDKKWKKCLLSKSFVQEVHIVDFYDAFIFLEQSLLLASAVFFNAADEES